MHTHTHARTHTHTHKHTHTFWPLAGTEDAALAKEVAELELEGAVANGDGESIGAAIEALAQTQDAGSEAYPGIPQRLVPQVRPNPSTMSGNPNPSTASVSVCLCAVVGR